MVKYLFRLNKVKKIAMLICGCFLPSLASCSPDTSGFEKYYEVNGVGLEAYCWKEKNSWYTCLLPERAAAHHASDVIELQETLPCPLRTMREILKSYSDEYKKYTRVTIVSNPATEDEMYVFGDECFKKYDTYSWLYEQLGLEMPENFCK